MKLLGILFLTCSAGSMMLAQKPTLIEKTYIQVVKEGSSTAPSFIVVTINNLNTGKSKEICTDVSTLSWCLKQENKDIDEVSLFKMMLNHAKDRTFDLKREEALSHLNFEKYSLKDEERISRLILENHVVDSLKKLSRLRKKQLDEFYQYAAIRSAILNKMADSIQSIRPLDQEEKKILSNLKDQYYDDYYSDIIFDQYRTISVGNKALIKNWNHSIKFHKDNYAKITSELSRQQYKFFESYFHTYGTSFAHVAFKFGIISYMGDEVPVAGFSEVIN